MSKYTIVSALQKELKKINQEIDQKIINGKSYYWEARRHKRLSVQLSRIHGRSSRIFSFF